MRLDLAALEPADRDRIGPPLLAMLVHSRFRRPRDWPKACVIRHPERSEVVARTQAVAELMSAGLCEAAHECRVRHVRGGEILVWLVTDTEDHAIAGLLVVNLLGSGRP